MAYINEYNYLSKKKYSIVCLIFTITSILCLIRFQLLVQLHAYSFIFFGIVFIVLSLNYNFKLNYSFFIIISLALSIAIFFFIFSGNDVDNVIYYIIVFNFPIIFYFITIIMINKIEVNLLINLIKKLLLYFIFYLLIEVIIRYYLGFKEFKEGSFLNGFYQFKYGTISYIDSNLLALHILNVMCLMLFLEYITKEKIWFIYFYILLFFAIMTLSRAVIITIFCLLYLKHIIKMLRKKNYLRMFFLIIIFFIITSIVYMLFIKDDASFITKLLFISKLDRVMQYPLLNVLFGFGFSEGGNMYSTNVTKWGHTHITILIGQYGIIGTLLFVLILLYYLFKTRSNGIYLILAFLISGFSLMHINSSFFWVLGIITVLSQKKQYILS